MTNSFGNEVYNQGEYIPPNSQFIARHKQLYGMRNYYKSFINNNYKFVVEYSLYYKIVFRIFELIVEGILKGEVASSPFGCFNIFKVRRKQKAIDYISTNIERRKQNDNSIIIYRTNNYYYRIDWTKYHNIENITKFKFEVNMLKAHEIPKYQDFHINVPTKE